MFTLIIVEQPQNQEKKQRFIDSISSSRFKQDKQKYSHTPTYTHTHKHLKVKLLKANINRNARNHIEKKYVKYKWGFPDSSVDKESFCNAGDPGLIPGSRRSPGEGKGYPLQYSGLEIPWTVQSMGSERVGLE